MSQRCEGDEDSNTPGESTEMDSITNPGLVHKERFEKKCHKLNSRYKAGEPMEIQDID